LNAPKPQAGLVKSKIPSFVLIIIAAVAVALLAKYAADHRYVPESFVLPIYAVIVLVAGYLAIRIVNGLLERIAEPTLGATHTAGVKNVFSLVAGVVLIVLVFAIFGFNLTGALIGAGFLGIVLGLAGQQVLGNVFAGLSILVSRPFEVGDRIKLSTSSYGLTGSSYSQESDVSGFTGIVQEVGIFFTRVKLDTGLPAVFPNSVVIGALILNYSRISLRTVRVRMDLDKKIDFEKFKAKLLDSLAKYDTIDRERTTVEILVMGTTTYEIVVAVWTSNEFDEPVKTLVIREGLKAEAEFSNTAKQGES
jgi:small conductance mechanosensitive channel